MLELGPPAKFDVFRSSGQGARTASAGDHLTPLQIGTHTYKDGPGTPAVPAIGPQRCGLRGGYFDLHNFRTREWKPAQLAVDSDPLRRVYERGTPSPPSRSAPASWASRAIWTRSHAASALFAIVLPRYMSSQMAESAQLSTTVSERRCSMRSSPVNRK